LGIWDAMPRLNLPRRDPLPRGFPSPPPAA